MGTLFGTVRSKTDKPGWTFLKGDQPPALEIERVLALSLGEPKFVCRRKDGTGDPDQAALEIITFIVGWFGFSMIGFALLGFWFRVTLIEWFNIAKDHAKTRWDEA